MSFWQDKRIVVTGGAGFLGSHVVDRLRARGVRETQIVVPRRATSDLRQLDACRRVLEGADIVLHLAAVVGGIGYNQAHPGQLFYDNILIGTQIMEAARLEGVAKVVSTGTICAYPKHTPIPFSEDMFWAGYPEETNAAYALAKKMLLVQGQAYRQEYGLNNIYLLLANLYGPRDNFDMRSSHVIPALIKKCLEARWQEAEQVVIWGSGAATREFLYVEDAAEGLLLAAEHYDGAEPINLGSGGEISIRELAQLIVKATGFTGRLAWDTSRPDGQPRRCIDVTRARQAFGFQAAMGLLEGLSRTVEWYCAAYAEQR